MAFEMPGMTSIHDALSTSSIGYGFAEPWAQYTEKIVDPPEGADLIEEWEFFYGLAQRMGLKLYFGNPKNPIAVDMQHRPDTHQIFEWITMGSRIPLSVVKAAPQGDVFREEPVIVEPRDPNCVERLDVGNKEMLSDLSAEWAKPDAGSTGEYPFRLIARRLASAYNSSGHQLDRLNRGKTYNPAFMHPDDMKDLGVARGDVVEISGKHASIPGIAEPDASIRRGLVSMSHAWGDVPDKDGEVREIGSNTGRLVDNESNWDRYSGIPAMSNIPVAVRPYSQDL
jgi:anaerobic selenocysteine-containing dehydrogenase